MTSLRTSASVFPAGACRTSLDIAWLSLARLRSVARAIVGVATHAVLGELAVGLGDQIGITSPAGGGQIVSGGLEVILAHEELLGDRGVELGGVVRGRAAQV